jgi:hypothetical protein
VCYTNGSQTYVHFPTSGTNFDTSEVDGYAIQDSNGDWTYNAASWASILGGQGSGPAAACEGTGADTTGATAEFYLLNGLTTPPAIGLGTTVMLYKEMVLESKTSVLDPRTYALYWGPYGGSTVEFGHGLWGIWFCFRLEGLPYCDFWVDSWNYDRIVEITAYVIGHSPPITGGGDYYTVYWTVDIPLRNVD